MSTPPTNKTCINCKVLKNLPEFNQYTTKSGKLVIESFCKPCYNERAKFKRLVKVELSEILNLYNAFQDTEKITEEKICNTCSKSKILTDFKIFIGQYGNTCYIDICKKCNDKNTVVNYKEQRSAYSNKYDKARRLTDPEFRTYKNLRSRLWMLINKSNTQKADHTIDLIGCSKSYFMKWLEFQFTPEMSWENQGKYWHLDHVTPCASFNIIDPEQQKICCHWSNCSPLEGSENISKNDQIFPEKIEAQRIKALKYYNNNKNFATQPN